MVPPFTLRTVDFEDMKRVVRDISQNYMAHGERIIRKFLAERNGEPIHFMKCLKLRFVEPDSS
jgi:hypothetical protein